MNPKLFLNARKLHRIVVVVISILGLIMAGTGTVMRFPDVFGGVFHLGDVIEIHETVSMFFAVVLIVQIVTGIILYVFPLIPRKR